MMISQKDRERLRSLAKEQLEISQLPIMAERKQRWIDHNDLKRGLPLIHFEMASVIEKGFNPQPECEGEDARKIEREILNNSRNHKMVDDDRVVPNDYTIQYRAGLEPFDMPVKRINTDGVGFHIEPQIGDLTTDMHLIKKSTTSFDKPGTLEWKAVVEDVIGDILPVRIGMGCIYAGITNNIVQRMTMENMFTAMIETPDEFHRLMDSLTDDYVAYFKELESRQMLCLNNGNDWLAQGSFGFTTALPSAGFDPSHIKTTDCWGYLDSQETVGVSPTMFHEFIYPYYKKLSDCYGLLSYGCCEPVHAYWDKSISKLTHIRKVSISPWCDEKMMGERLSDRKVIYLRKPSPNFVSLTDDLDEEAYRKHIDESLFAAKDCQMEFAFRDIYTLHGGLNKPRRIVEILREEIDKYYKV